MARSAWVFLALPDGRLHNGWADYHSLESFLMPFQLVPTEDGSLSCLDSETGQLSHNRAGAYSESVHLYARPSGLLDLAFHQGEIRVLDACYGMGYNTWSLINELIRLEQQPGFIERWQKRASDKPVTVSLVGIEKHPEVLDFLPLILDTPTFDPLKEKIRPEEHNAYYRTLQCCSDTKVGGIEVRKLVIDVAPFWRFELELWVDDLRHRVPLLEGPFDAIFHDPFSPQKMPELWTFDLFCHYFRLLAERKGRLLTYSAAAATRGGMMEAGFSIAMTPGLGSKGGGTIGLVPASALNDTENAVMDTKGRNPLEDFSQFEPWEHEYLHSKAGIPYRDPGLCQTRGDILAHRDREQAASTRPSGSSALKKKPRYQPK